MLCAAVHSTSFGSPSAVKPDHKTVDGPGLKMFLPLLDSHDNREILVSGLPAFGKRSLKGTGPSRTINLKSSPKSSQGLTSSEPFCSWHPSTSPLGGLAVCGLEL